MIKATDTCLLSGNDKTSSEKFGGFNFGEKVDCFTVSIHANKISSKVETGCDNKKIWERRRKRGLWLS